MRRYEGYDEAEVFSGEFETLQPGGYVCIIKNVVVEEAKPGKNYDNLMVIDYDIAEGEFRGFYKKKYDSMKEKDSTKAKWQGKYYQTIIQDRLGFFKGMMTAIERSNAGYKWDWNENSLIGKTFGGIFGEEEYLGNDGNVKTSVKLKFIRSIDEIRKGVKIPEKKKIDRKVDDGFYPIDDDTPLPWELSEQK